MSAAGKNTPPAGRYFGPANLEGVAYTSTFDGRNTTIQVEKSESAADIPPTPSDKATQELAQAAFAGNTVTFEPTFEPQTVLDGDQDQFVDALQDKEQ